MRDIVECCLYEEWAGMIEFDVIGVGSKFNVWEGIEEVIDED